MGQQLVSRTSSGCSGNPTAAPVRTAPTPVTIAAGAGATPAVVYAAAVGDKVPYGGQVLKTNECDRLKIVVSYLDKGDCNVCTPDDLELKEETYFAEAGGAGYDLGPIGFVAKVEVTVVDSAGAPTTSVLGGDVSFMSERAALCNEVLMPEIEDAPAFDVLAKQDVTFLTLLPAGTTFTALGGSPVFNPIWKGGPLLSTSFVVKADRTGIEPTSLTGEFLTLANFQIGDVFQFELNGLVYTLTTTQV